MPQSTAAGIITASAAVFTSLALVITAIAGLIAARRVGRKVDAVETKVNDVHVLVNGASEEARQEARDRKNYQRALIGALLKHGIEVPEDQSADPGPSEPTPQPA